MMTKKTELNKEEANYSVIYKSKLLNKEFDSLEELKTAEDNFKLSESKIKYLTYSYLGKMERKKEMIKNSRKRNKRNR